MSINLKAYKRCPICKLKKQRETKLGYLNRYSEELSKFFFQEEKSFNLIFKNIKCEKCNLIYKSKWFKERELNLIFNKVVPQHPKGWDRLSKKFSKKHFRILNKKIIKTLRGNKRSNINRITREIISFIDSMKFFNGISNIKKNFINHLQNKNFKGINHELKKISKNIKQPAEFSRFTGFESQNLINHIESKIGNISSYSEIGCPLWGNLNFLSKKKVNCSFIKGKEYEFWGKNCKKRNLLCSSKLNKKIKKIGNLENCNFNKKHDFVGIFLYLDHVANPLKFFSNIFKNFNSCGIILENSAKGVPIQHFTGWSKKSLYLISKKFNKKLDDSFKPLSLKNKSFFLLY